MNPAKFFRILILCIIIVFDVAMMLWLGFSAYEFLFGMALTAVFVIFMNWFIRNMWS